MSGLIENELEYTQTPVEYGEYKLTEIANRDGQNGITLTTGGRELVFELPTKVYNFARSYFHAEISCDASSSSQAAYTFVDILPFISEVYLSPISGNNIVDVKSANNFYNVISRYETKLDSIEDNYIAPFTGLVPNRVPTQYISKAELHSNAVGGGGTTVTDKTVDVTYANSIEAIRPNNTTAFTQWHEARYLEVSRSGGVPALDYSTDMLYRVPLSVFKNTLLALDKDIYFGQVMKLRIVLAHPSKVYFYSASVSNPASTPAPGTEYTIENYKLWMAIETNPVHEQKAIDNVNSGAFNMMIPFVYTSVKSLQGTTQDVQITYDSLLGKKLQKIYWAPFNTTESGNTAYDHSNIAGSKIVRFETKLNNNRRQEFPLDCTEYDDYILRKDKLKGSCILSPNEYYYNWCWCEDFTDNRSIEDKSPLDVPDENRLMGKDFNKDMLYQIHAYVDNAYANASLHHYVFAIVLRQLTIGPNIIEIQ